MVSSIFTGCLSALVSGIIIAVTVVFLAVIIYFVAGFIAALIETFKELMANRRAAKLLNALKSLGSAIETKK